MRICHFRALMPDRQFFCRRYREHCRSIPLLSIPALLLTQATRRHLRQSYHYTAYYLPDPSGNSDITDIYGNSVIKKVASHKDEIKNLDTSKPLAKGFRSTTKVIRDLEGIAQKQQNIMSAIAKIIMNILNMLIAMPGLIADAMGAGGLGLEQSNKD